MEDTIRLAVVVIGVIVLTVLVPAALYSYMARRKVAWRKKINIGWRRHATEEELKRSACGETRDGRVTR